MDAPRPRPDAPTPPKVAPADAVGGAVDQPVTQPADPGSRARLVRIVALYTALRLGLLAVLTVALVFVMPLIVALAFAVVLQLPLALLLFRGPRHQLTQALAGTRSRRTAERERLRAALRGDTDTV